MSLERLVRDREGLQKGAVDSEQAEPLSYL